MFNVNSALGLYKTHITVEPQKFRPKKSGSDKNEYKLFYRVQTECSFNTRRYHKHSVVEKGHTTYPHSLRSRTSGSGACLHLSHVQSVTSSLLYNRVIVQCCGRLNKCTVYILLSLIHI